MTPSSRTHSQSHALRTTLTWLVKIGVSVGLMYLLLSRVDLPQLWQVARTASLPWLLLALAIYTVSALISVWRWGLLLRTQHVEAGFGTLTNSFLVAAFFSNFLPSNIGGDVVRIRDTARAAGSKTLATTVVLLDRVLGLLGLVCVSAIGATNAAWHSEQLGALGPGMLWLILLGGCAVLLPFIFMPRSADLLLRPLALLHQEWFSERITRLTTALGKFGAAPVSLLGGFAGAVAVQGLIVGFYGAVAHALRIPISIDHLAMLVPLSLLIQLLPVSLNGFGVREATFSVYFTRLHLPIESAIALSFIAAMLIMAFSMSGAVSYLIRRSHLPARHAHHTPHS